MTTYTKIPKPVGTSYTNRNAAGKQQYDQADITYDDSSVFYDSVSQNMYTKISKPTSTPYTKIPKPV